MIIQLNTIPVSIRVERTFSAIRCALCLRYTKGIVTIILVTAGVVFVYFGSTTFQDDSAAVDHVERVGRAEAFPAGREAA